ncbi:hypothetical protein Tco_1287362 [Tanacetum coccineum]
MKLFLVSLLHLADITEEGVTFQVLSLSLSQDNILGFKEIWDWQGRRRLNRQGRKSRRSGRLKMLSGRNLLTSETKAIQEAITIETISPKTDREILAEVTKSTNRVHIAGVGTKLAGTGNLDFGRLQPTQILYPGAIRRPEKATCVRTPLQFQIPDLYTPQVFPGSISTPGGPSSTSPAPSSTPLGLGNCYTPTFDPETSQSGEQDDNSCNNGNREYDVDIYDDE